MEKYRNEYRVNQIEHFVEKEKKVRNAWEGK